MEERLRTVAWGRENRDTSLRTRDYMDNGFKKRTYRQKPIDESLRKISCGRETGVAIYRTETRGNGSRETQGNSPRKRNKAGQRAFPHYFPSFISTSRNFRCRGQQNQLYGNDLGWIHYDCKNTPLQRLWCWI